MAEPHGSDWAVSHDLEVVDLRLSFLDDSLASVTMVGRSHGKRTALWTHEVHGDLYESSHELLSRAHDIVEILVRCRPTSREQMLHAITYGTVTWAQIPLPY